MAIPNAIKITPPITLRTPFVITRRRTLGPIRNRPVRGPIAAAPRGQADPPPDLPGFDYDPALYVRRGVTITAASFTDYQVTEHLAAIKLVCDVGAGCITLGALVGALPSISAGLSIVWLSIQIWRAIGKHQGERFSLLDAGDRSAVRADVYRRTLPAADRSIIRLSLTRSRFPQALLRPAVFRD